MIVLPQPEVVMEGLCMPETPRWYEGEFYCSNMWAGRVDKLDRNGRVSTVAEYPGEYSGGLGFLPNGDLLAVQMKSRHVVRISGGTISVYADLSSFTPFHINDMVVDRQGRAYISQPGFNFFGDMSQMRPTDIILIETDGSARIVASDMLSPNGMAINAEGTVLFVAETIGRRITSFTIEADGSLSNQQVFAEMPDNGIPDGICLDDSGGVWVGVPISLSNLDGYGNGVQRITEGGVVTHTIPMAENRRGVACVFGGDDRRSLYICTTDVTEPNEVMAKKSGRVERIKLDFQGAGLP